MQSIDKKAIVQYLKESEFGYYGIKRPQNLSKGSSIEPVAIVAYVLSKIGVLDDVEKKQYIARIVNAKTSGGPFYTINNVLGVWATSQACLALDELGCNYSEFKDSINWLCEKQSDDGGWSYDGVYSDTSIIHAFYTLLVLKKYADKDSRIETAISKSIPYLLFIRDNHSEKSSSRLMALYLLDVLGVQQNKDTIENVISKYIDETVVSLSDIPYVDFDSHNTFTYVIGFYFPASYLLLRRYILPQHPFSQFLMQHLAKTIIEGNCWKPNMTNNEPMSWTTALSLYSIDKWEKDCLTEKCTFELMNEDQLLRQLKHSNSREQIEKPEYVNRTCPLNDGDCNKMKHITSEYNAMKVFLDIPYADNYEDYENRIISILQEKKMIPVLAKDTTKSNILLCKICQCIQTCAYGIADISALKSNIYFELGMLFGMSKNCILLKKRGAETPDLLSGIECIEYVSARELGEKLNQWLDDNIGENGYDNNLSGSVR